MTHNPYWNASGVLRWTEDEDQTLLRMYDNGDTFPQIGKALDRSSVAARLRAGHLRRTGKLTKPRQEAWNANNTEIAREMLARDAPDEEFMRILGRTKRAADHRMRRVKQAARMIPGAPTQIQSPPSVIEERNARSLQSKSLTASLMGDPEPGRARL